MPSTREGNVALASLRLLLPLGLCTIGTILALATHHLDAFSSSPYPIAAAPAYHQALAGRAPVAEIAADAEWPLIPKEYEIRRGETLGTLLESHGVSAAEARQALAALGGYLDVRRVRAGQRYAVLDRPGRGPEEFQFEVAGEGRVLLARHDESWQGSWEPYRRETRLAAVTGVLEGSLDESLRRSGGAPSMAYKMAEVLQWDLDFNRDLRRGDRFEALYEEVYLDGALHSTGNVLALTYETRGRRHEVYRWGNGGYYTADGRPLEKMFLRSPLRYSRVTSRFSHRRFHPVLKKYRPHYGVDYGASVGTPVRVTASGTVTFAGWASGGGNTVKVRHANGYLTAYLHLSRFAKGVRPGARVHQGELIAYTGATGLASGPHLDYRVQKNGRWIDPLSLKNVPADSIPTGELDRFFAWRDACRSSLESGEPLPELAVTQPDVRLAAAPEAAGSAAIDFGTAGR